MLSGAVPSREVGRVHGADGADSCSRYVSLGGGQGQAGPGGTGTESCRVPGYLPAAHLEGLHPGLSAAPP